MTQLSAAAEGASSRPVTTPERRAAVLRELGLSPLRRRHVVSPAPDPVLAPAVAAAMARCVIVLPAAGDARALDLLGRALTAAGAPLARAGRIRVADGVPSAAVPAAAVYLVLGQAQAQALGRELSAADLAQAHIALVEEPEHILHQGPSKRALWTALRQVRRVLAQTAAGAG